MHNHPHSEQTKRIIGKKARDRIAKQGHPKGMLGKHHTEESNAQRRTKCLSYWTQERRNERALELQQRWEKKSLKDNSGFHNPMFGKKHSLMSKSIMKSKGRMRMQDPVKRKKFFETLNQWPNKTEQKMYDLLKSSNMPFVYSGKGQYMVGLMAPDFIDIEGHRVIEVFGDYWHRGEDPKEKIAQYKKFGYACFVVWEHELNSNQQLVIDNINEWVNYG